MSNYLTITAEFERQKNLRASLLTLGIGGLILLLAIFLKWPLPTLPEPQIEEAMEVNLGTSDDGFGSDQPLLPGDPAPEQLAANTPPQPVAAVEEDVRDVETDDNSDAPAITRPVVTRPEARKINAESRVVKTPSPAATQPAAAPAPPRPKAIMNGTRGGTGLGGNGADTYRPGGSEGDGSGSGDKGVAGGNPEGRSYSGTPRRLGARIAQIPPRNFEDDFDESGKVILEIQVNDNGKLVSATYQPRGSTIANRRQIEMAKRYAAQIDYPKYDGGFRQPLEIRFDKRN